MIRIVQLQILKLTAKSRSVGKSKKGAEYWEAIIERGRSQLVLGNADIYVLNDAIKYCKMQYNQLTKRQIKVITDVVVKLKENGIE